MRYESSLPARLSELVILLVARAWTQNFEWAVHAPIAERAGISGAAVAAIKIGHEPSLKDDESAVYAFTRELLVMHQVRDTTYGRLIAVVGAGGAVDLVGIVGYYSMICMTINAFQVQVPAGTSAPFERPG